MLKFSKIKNLIRSEHYVLREQITRLKQLNDYLLGLIDTNRLTIQIEKANRTHSTNHMSSTVSKSSNNLSNEFVLLQISARKSNEQQDFQEFNTQKNNFQRIFKKSSFILQLFKKKARLHARRWLELFFIALFVQLLTVAIFLWGMVIFKQSHSRLMLFFSDVTVYWSGHSFHGIVVISEWVQVCRLNWWHMFRALLIKLWIGNSNIFQSIFPNTNIN